MNICFLTVKDLLNGAGVEKYTREVGRRLVERGHGITVYSSGGDADVVEWNGIHIVALPKVEPHWIEKMYASALAAASAWRNPAPDVFHFHGVGPGAMALVLAGKAPVVLQLHGVEWRRSRWGLLGKTVIRFLEPCAFLRADSITAVSQVQCGYYSERIGRPIHFIPTAAEVRSPVSPCEMLSLGLTPGRFVFFASRLVSEKGLHYLLEAFRSLPHNYSLVVAGDGPANSAYVREVRSLAARDPRVRLLGHVRGPLLDELFSNAAVFVQPSDVEGMAIALLEAMSFGNICVASDIPENLEALANAGLAFRARDPEDLREKLHSILSHPQDFEHLRTTAKKRVEQLYSWDQVTYDLEQLYLQVIATSNMAASKSYRRSRGQEPA